MKILFLIFHGFAPDNGISKKISYQLEAFRSLGHEAHICYMDETATKRRMVDQQVIADYGAGFFSKVKKRVEFSSVVQFCREQGIEFVYIRSNHNANPFTLHMVRRMKRMGMKVVMEIPTYPYDSEYCNWHLKRQLLQDKVFRYRFARALDAIVTFSDDDFIFGQRTIRISNGIDFDSVGQKPCVNDTSKELNLIGVAEIHGWHGFDRVVKGLADYYSQPQTYIVRFHIVGYFYSAEEEAEVREIVTRCGMEDYVIFHGKQHGEQLDQIFAQCDFGIGSLGRHRVGIYRMKTLKNREYAARGIPFTYSENDDDFDAQPYVLKMPPDETPVDIRQIVSFYRQLQVSPAQIRQSIGHLSWKHQMEQVLQGVYPPERKGIRLAYCIPSLDRPSGMERVLTIKANYLADRLGYDVYIILTDNKESKPFFPLSARVHLVQLDVNIDSLWRYPFCKRLCLYLRKKRQYRRLLERELMWLKPDITISLLRREINFLTGIADGSKKMGEIHFGRYKYREAHFRFLPRWANEALSALWMRQLDRKVRQLDRFVVLTHEDAAQWKRVERISVISNPLTIDSAARSPLTAKRVIAVGRYTYQKGFDLLIQAWQQVERLHPDWQLHIYGAGDRGSYEQLVADCGVQQSVCCHPATSDIVAEYQHSSVFAFSSRFEGFGLVLAEAMSVGLPCVSFACPCGPRDIIRDGEDGILCQAGNIGQLAEGLCRLIQDDTLRQQMGQAAYRNIQRYSLDAVMRQWDELFHEVLGS